MKRETSLKTKMAVAAGAALLALALAGCAPEAGEIAGSTEKDTQTINPESEASEREVTEYELSTEMPESFPSEEFALPDGAVVHDVGESGVDRWFVVLLAGDAAEAEMWWDAIINTNELSVSEESETSEGGTHALLQGVTLQIEALSIPQIDGSIQMSYSLTRWA